MLELQRDSDFRQPPIKLLSNRPILHSVCSLGRARAILRSLIEIESALTHMVRLTTRQQGNFLTFLFIVRYAGHNSYNTNFGTGFFSSFLFI